MSNNPLIQEQSKPSFRLIMRCCSEGGLVVDVLSIQQMFNQVRSKNVTEDPVLRRELGTCQDRTVKLK